jgi:hypothetical protein
MYYDSYFLSMENKLKEEQSSKMFKTAEIAYSMN